MVNKNKVKMLSAILLLALAANAASAKDHHNYMLSDDFINEINSEATTWRAGRNFHPQTSTNYIKVCIDVILFISVNWQLISPFPRADLAGSPANAREVHAAAERATPVGRG